MRLVLIRHAKPTTGFTAFTTAISEEGRLIQMSMCKKLKEESIIPTKMFHSPLLRTEQTATVIGDFFDVTSHTMNALGEDFDEPTIINTLASLSQEETVFLVGHGPSLYTFAHTLTGTPCLTRELSRSGACVLQFSKKVAPGRATFIKTYVPS